MSRSVVQGGAQPELSGLELFLDGTSRQSYPGQGSVWFDLSGRGNNFTLNNSPTNDGSGFTFNGTNQWAGCTNIDCGNFGSGSFTIEYGISYGPITLNTQCTISKRSNTVAPGGSSNAGWMHRVGTAPNAIMFAHDNVPSGSPSPPSGSTNGSVLLNSMNNITGSNVHIVHSITNDGVGLMTGRLYRNGELLNTANYQWSNYISPNPGSVDNNVAIRIMRDGQGSAFLAGKVFFVRLYRKALTQAEVLQNYESAKTILQI